MNIKKYLMLGGVALSLGLSTASCVGDLDLDPIDPNLEPNPSTERLINEAMECYQGLATSGNDGPAPPSSPASTTAAASTPAPSS